MNLHKTEEVTMEEAITSWFDTVYLPLASIIIDKKILRSFPKKTSGDLYVWTVRYWDDLKRKFGSDVPMEDAVIDFKEQYKIPLRKRIINRIKRILLIKEIDNNDK